MKAGKPRRGGISSLLATVLILVVAVALVGIVWAISSGMIGTGAVKADIAIEKLDLVANGNSVVMVRNLGNVRIDSIDSVDLACDVTASPTPPTLNGPIDPGETASAAWQAGVVPGETCTLTVEATAANGANVAASSSAIVRP